MAARKAPRSSTLLAAQAGCQVAAEAVIEASEWLVSAALKGWPRQEHDDLRQAALIGSTGARRGGMLGAIDTFDPCAAACWWTHATVWVRGAVWREYHTQLRPFNFRRVRRQRLRAARRLAREYGRALTATELDALVELFPRIEVMSLEELDPSAAMRCRNAMTYRIDMPRAIDARRMLTWIEVVATPDEQPIVEGILQGDPIREIAERTIIAPIKASGRFARLPYDCSAPRKLSREGVRLRWLKILKRAQEASAFLLPLETAGP